jgi:hypothetical protein
VLAAVLRQLEARFHVYDISYRRQACVSHLLVLCDARAWQGAINEEVVVTGQIAHANQQHGVGEEGLGNGFIEQTITVVGPSHRQCRRPWFSYCAFIPAQQ